LHCDCHRLFSGVVRDLSDVWRRFFANSISTTTHQHSGRTNILDIP